VSGDLQAVMMGEHAVFAARFHAHQVALLDRDFARAARELAAYRDALFAHAAAEERHVLPRYEALGGDATDAPLRLFLGEHANLRRFVDEFVARVAALAKVPDDRALLELFDREATFKNLVLHHDLRERNVLYPFLAARLPATDQAAVLAACSPPRV
jgi:hemerythrin-like domain-containing protein